MFHDEPHRAWSLPQGPRGLLMVALLGQPIGGGDTQSLSEEAGER